MSTIYLVRHGETEWNQAGVIQGHSGVQLSALGITQLEEVGALLRTFALRAALLVSSDTIRCAQSATIIGQYLALKPQMSPALREVEFGVWTGRTIRKLRSCADECRAWDTMSPSYHWEGGESFRLAHKRAHHFIAKLLDAKKGRDIIVVTHGFIAQLLISWWLVHSFRCAKHITIATGSLSIVRFAGSGPFQLVATNLLGVDTRLHLAYNADKGQHEMVV